MKILFLARHFSYLRLFESAILELAQRGHTLHLSADREESMGGRGMVERIAAEFPGVTVGWTPGRESGTWYELARKLRLGLDYLRYLDSRYANTAHLRARSRERAPGIVVMLAALPLLRTTPGRRMLAAILRGLERSIPRSAEIDAFLREQNPDLLLITPLVDLGSPQADHFASARAAGIRTVLCVGSWDHLSSKALLRQFPDRITVWNEIQKKEAVELHGVPPERVTVTGAQSFDQWFGRKPTRTRREFCHRVGLDPDKPFVLWVSSSLFRRTANDAHIAEQWIQALRTSDDPVVREAGILVRPHPSRLDEWQNIDLTAYKNVAFWGAHPVDPEAKDDYFESLHYSAAVVGTNTSAFLEAGIVGREVYAILLPDVSPNNQEGTIHFHYLLDVAGGLLHTSRSMEEHVAQIRDAIAAPAPIESIKSRRFTEAFIRPFGIDQPATPRFADAIEAEGRLGRSPINPASAALGLAYRALLLPWLLIMHAKVASQPWRKELRYKTRKAVRHYSKQFWLQLKSFAATQIKGKRAYEGRKVIGGANLTPKLGKPRDPAKLLTFPGIPEVEETKETVTLLGRNRRPIIVGPWLTETGFELLYWIPFVAWAKAYGGLRDDQLYVVSRGGCAPWYRHITPNYIDVLSFYSPDEFRTLNEERALKHRGRFKHMDVSTFDQAIIERVTAKLGLDKPNLLHPSLMYNLFNVYWRQMAPVTLVEAFTVFKQLPPAGIHDLAAHLPERYVAVKFYSNMALPDSPENRKMISEILRELTRTTDVVLLNTGTRFDDHTDYPIEVRGRLHRIDHLMTPENNLHIQTKVISGATAFVGTYGGFSYLAPLLGTDTLAFFSHPTGFRWDHLELAKRVFSSLRGGAFVALNTRDLDVVRLGFAGGTAAPGGKPQPAEAVTEA
jgi:hypothetical protein